jgi:Lrp/AsnC family leucine-responsive transcriptional regulator
MIRAPLCRNVSNRPLPRLQRLYWHPQTDPGGVMRGEFDSTDRLLLDLLERDARTSTAMLAARTGETPADCEERVRRLTSAGHILGYRAVRGFPDPDEQPIMLLIFIQRSRSMSGKDVLRSLRAVPEVISCDVADGAFDLLLRVRVASEDRATQIESFFRRQVGVHDVSVVRPVSSMLAV